MGVGNADGRFPPSGGSNPGHPAMPRTMELIMVTMPLPTALPIVLAAEHAACLLLPADRDATRRARESMIPRAKATPGGGSEGISKMAGSLALFSNVPPRL